jgi:hypothetical protein
VDCKGKFSSQKVGRSGAQLPLFSRNPPLVDTLTQSTDSTNPFLLQCFFQDYVKNNILKAEKLSDEKFYDLKNNIHR